MAEYSSLLDEVLPDVPGCTTILGVREIRNAVIEICKSAGLIRRTVENAVVTANDPLVTIPATTGFMLQHLKNVTVDRKPVEHTSQDALDLMWNDRTHQLWMHYDWHNDDCGGLTESWRVYTQQRPMLYYLEKDDAGDRIRLVGIPTRGYTDLKYTKVLVPLRDSTGVDSWFLERYYLQISWGAIAALKSMRQTTWFDPAGAVDKRAMFDTWLSQAGRDAATDFTRDDESTGRVQSHY